MKLEARKIDDGKGPYRWRPIIRTNSGLALGGIYDSADLLGEEEAAAASFRLADTHELRECA